MDTLVGRTVLGGLAVVREIGRGGFARVYEVRLGSGEAAALKVLHPSYLEDANAAARLFREALVTERARSSRVVQVFGVGTLEDGAAYVLMELLVGRTLATRLGAEGSLAPGEAVRLALEVAEGLGAAHEVGVVHRDVKPANVFLVRGPDSRETVKVVDFGISKLLPGAEDRFGALTKSGAILGTPRYLSPEQAASDQPTAAADQYALGVTLYEMLSGEVPYDVVNIAQGIADILTGRPKPLSDVAPSIEPALAAVVMRTLRREPEARYASMAELSAALSPFLDSTRAAAPPRRDESSEMFATTLGLDAVGLQALQGDVVPAARSAPVGLRPEPRTPSPSPSWSVAAPAPPTVARSGVHSGAPAPPRSPAHPVAHSGAPSPVHPTVQSTAPMRVPRAAPVSVARAAPRSASGRGRRLLAFALASIGLLSVLIAALVGGALILMPNAPTLGAGSERDGPASDAEGGADARDMPWLAGPDVGDPRDTRPILTMTDADELRATTSDWQACVDRSHEFQDTGRNVQLRIWCASQGNLTAELRATCELYLQRFPGFWVPSQCYRVIGRDEQGEPLR